MINKPNPVERALRKCQVTIKALQNLNAALFCIGRLAHTLQKEEPEVLSSLFLSAVIRYGRPFTKSRTGSGNVSLRTKPLRDIADFDAAMHDHLMFLRDRLLAHDDLEEIPPPVMTSSIQPKGSSISIPLVIYVSNRALAYPADQRTADKVLKQVGAAFLGVDKQMTAAIEEYRTAVIAHPEEAESLVEISEDHGTATSPTMGKRFNPPDLSGHEFLRPRLPDFSHIQSGYHYESLNLARRLSEPLKVKLEDGNMVVITPPKPGSADSAPVPPAPVTKRAESSAGDQDA